MNNTHSSIDGGQSRWRFRPRVCLSESSVWHCKGRSHKRCAHKHNRKIQNQTGINFLWIIRIKSSAQEENKNNHNKISNEEQRDSDKSLIRYPQQAHRHMQRDLVSEWVRESEGQQYNFQWSQSPPNWCVGSRVIFKCKMLLLHKI